MVEQISVTILTKNLQKYLKRCLDALQEFNEIVIMDNGSSDKTLKIAENYPNTKIVEHEFIGFGPLKNLAIKYAPKKDTPPITKYGNITLLQANMSCVPCNKNGCDGKGRSECLYNITPEAVFNEVKMVEHE